MELLFFILASVGMCLIITDGSIFSPLKIWLANKGWKKLVDYSNCAHCTGFACGILCGFFINPMPDICFPVALFSYGCVCSLISYFTAVVIGYLLANGQINE
jgi:hypothetical protein